MNKAPANLDAEQALLGAILVNNAALDLVAHIVQPRHFSEKLHAVIFEAATALIGAGQRADPVLLGARIGDVDVGGMNLRQYLARLMADATTIINAPDYARAVRDSAVRRDVYAVARDVLDIAGDPATGLTGDEQATEALNRFEQVRELHRIGESGRSIGDLLDEHDDLRFRGDTMRNALCSWVIPEIADVVDGDMEAGSLYGLLGASGEGKSSLAVQQVFHCAANGLPGLFLSGEQTKDQCVDQLLAQQLGISAKDIKRNRVSAEEYGRIADLKARMRQLPLAIQEWPEEPVAGISRRVRAFVRKFGPCFFALDHGSMIVPDNPREMFAESVRRSYAGLKRICVETGSVGMVLMHRNSDFLSRRHMRPVRADVYGKEVTLRALDACLAIYRPSLWLRDKADIEEKDSLRSALLDAAVQRDGWAELYSLKTRFGAPGRHRVWSASDNGAVIFDEPFTRFLSPVRQRAARQPELL